ncbi:MAG TPA: NAD(P)-dependent alcohol dehydrogenase [Bryobacteraceae bacterium]|nr:NAD(P)-dependent alcohol dehydrogenase [Bryobacteraceae bacterium]
MSAPHLAPQAARQAKAIRTTGGTSIDELVLDKVPVPEPDPGQVLVAIKAVSLNYRDLAVVTGRYPRNTAQPTILCSDGAGEVVAVGAGVQTFRSGDRVVGSFFQSWVDGPYAREHGASALGGAIDGVLTQYRVFDQQGLLPIPEHLSFEEAATLPCAGLTAWNALVPTCRVQASDTVLLLGTGGVSIFGLQFAKLHGARVIITSSSDEKLARAKALGADETINYKTTPAWDQEVLRLTGGKGVDIVLEVGGGETFPRSMNSVRASGQIAVIGVLSGVMATIPVGLIGIQTLGVRGIFVGSVAMFADMNRAIASNHVKPVVDRVFSFEQSADGLRCMQSAQHFGKIVITL